MSKTIFTHRTLIVFLFLLQIFVFIKADEPPKKPYILQNAFPNLKFNNPVDLTHAGDGTSRIFVVEKIGKIQVFENDPKTATASLFLDIKDKVKDEGECGLLGLAFHPKFKTNGYFYVNYVSKNPLKTVIARFQVDPKNPNQALPESFLSLLEIEQPYANHNGGQIVFGPDGFLYIGMGDGGSGGDPQNRAQNLKTLLGKMLRIDVDKTQTGLNYAIPPTNPFAKNALEYREEIYAFGLRNPWRFSFDSKTKKLWCADVGQNQWEEIDIVTLGGNFGWNFIEGNHTFKENKEDPQKFIPPVFEYYHKEGNCSITGGFVYHGKNLVELDNFYIYTDYCSRNIWNLNTVSKENTLIAQAPGPINSFGVDSKNELYLLCNNGTIYELIPDKK